MNDLHPLYEKANQLFFARKNEEAIVCFDDYVRQDPNNEVMWSNRAVVLSNLKRYDEALSSYDEAIRVKPREPTNYYDKGFTFEKMGRYKEALVWYDKALEISPDDEHIIKLKSKVLKILNSLIL